MDTTGCENNYSGKRSLMSTFRKVFKKKNINTNESPEPFENEESASSQSLPIKFLSSYGMSFRARFLCFDSATELLAICSEDGIAKVFHNSFENNQDKSLFCPETRSETLFFSPTGVGNAQSVFFYGNRGNFAIIHQTAVSFFHLNSSHPSSTIHFDELITTFDHQRTTDYALIGLNTGTTKVVILSKEAVSSFVIHPEVLLNALTTKPPLAQYKVVCISMCPGTPTHNLISLSPHSGSQFPKYIDYLNHNESISNPAQSQSNEPFQPSVYADYSFEDCYSPDPPILDATTGEIKRTPLRDLMICCDVSTHRCRDFRIAPFGRVYCVGWRYDSSMYSCGHANGIITIWNLKDTSYPQAIFVMGPKPENNSPITDLSWFKVKSGHTLAIQGGNSIDKPCSIFAVQGNFDEPASDYILGKAPPAPYLLSHRSNKAKNLSDNSLPVSGSEKQNVMDYCSSIFLSIYSNDLTSQTQKPDWIECPKNQKSSNFSLRKVNFFKRTSRNPLEGAIKFTLIYEKTQFSKQKNPNSILIVDGLGNLVLVGLQTHVSSLPFSYIYCNTKLRVFPSTFIGPFFENSLSFVTNTSNKIDENSIRNEILRSENMKNEKNEENQAPLVSDKQTSNPSQNIYTSSKSYSSEKNKLHRSANLDFDNFQASNANQHYVSIVSPRIESAVSMVKKTQRKTSFNEIYNHHEELNDSGRKRSTPKLNKTLNSHLFNDGYFASQRGGKITSPPFDKCHKMSPLSRPKFGMKSNKEKHAPPLLDRMADLVFSINHFGVLRVLEYSHQSLSRICSIHVWPPTSTLLNRSAKCLHTNPDNDASNMTKSRVQEKTIEYEFEGKININTTNHNVELDEEAGELSPKSVFSENVSNIYSSVRIGYDVNVENKTDTERKTEHIFKSNVEHRTSSVPKESPIPKRSSFEASRVRYLTKTCEPCMFHISPDVTITDSYPLNPFQDLSSSSLPSDRFFKHFVSEPSSPTSTSLTGQNQYISENEYPQFSLTPRLQSSSSQNDIKQLKNSQKKQKTKNDPCDDVSAFLSKSVNSKYLPNSAEFPKRIRLGSNRAHSNSSHISKSHHRKSSLDIKSFEVPPHIFSQPHFVEYLPIKGIIFIVSRSGYGEQLIFSRYERSDTIPYYLQPDCGHVLCMQPKPINSNENENEQKSIIQPPGLQRLSRMDFNRKVSCTASSPDNSKSRIAIGFDDGNVIVFEAGSFAPDLSVRLNDSANEHYHPKITALLFAELGGLTVLFVGNENGDIWCLIIGFNIVSKICSDDCSIVRLLLCNKQGALYRHIFSDLERTGNNYQALKHFCSSVYLIVISTNGCSICSLCVSEKEKNRNLLRSLFTKSTSPSQELIIHSPLQHCNSIVTLELSSSQDSEGSCYKSSVFTSILNCEILAKASVEILFSLESTCIPTISEGFIISDSLNSMNFLLFHTSSDTLFGFNLSKEVLATIGEQHSFNFPPSIQYDLREALREWLGLSKSCPIKNILLEIDTNGKAFACAEINDGFTNLVRFDFFDKTLNELRIELPPVPSLTPMKTFTSRFNILELEPEIQDSLDSVYMLPESREKVAHENISKEHTENNNSISHHLVPSSSHYQTIAQRQNQPQNEKL